MRKSEAASESVEEKGSTNDLTEDTKEIPRIFGFVKDKDEKEREIAVKKIGSFETLTKDLDKETDPEFASAKKIMDCFEKARTELKLPSGKKISKRPRLLIAGGFVRDTILGKKSKDIDFATNLEYKEIVELIKNSFHEEIKNGMISMEETGKDFVVMRLRFRDIEKEYEIATFRIDGEYKDGRHPESVSPTKYAGEDADRRDLTINALFYNPFSGNVIDYVGGLKDIEAKQLKFVGDPEKRISEDRLRMLRYVRFLMRTGFDETEEAKAAISKHAEEIKMLSAERTQGEINNIFKTGKVGASIEKLKEYGLLQHILPEIEELENCEQGPPYHTEGDVFKHTIMVANLLPENADINLRWAAVLHDISKPETKEEKTDKSGAPKVSFVGHAEPGAEKAQKTLNRLRFSNETIGEICWLIENHIRMFEFPNMREGKARELASSPYFLKLFELAKADARSSLPTESAVREENEKILEEIEKRYKEIKEFEEKKSPELSAIQKTINGYLIMEKYEKVCGKLPEGKIIGRIKNATLEKITNQKITDLDAALKILDETIEKSHLASFY